MRRQGGFSLIELMITIAIVGILAAIAIPSFAAAVAKSRQTEAKSGLAAIHTLEVAYFTEANSYGSLTDIGFVSEGSGRYGYILGSGSFVPPNNGGGDVGAGDLPSGWFGDTGPGGPGALGPLGPGALGPGAGGLGPGSGGPGMGGTLPDPPPGYATGNPHFGGSSFEAVAVGAISGAPMPNDVDIWSIDHFRSLENMNPGY